MQIGGAPLLEWPEEEVIRALEDVDITKYDVVIDESAWSPSVKMATFMMLSEMAQAGQPIPPEIIFEFADIPDDVRAKINESIAAQQQAQSGAQSATAEMEITKTIIGQGIIPPHIQEQYGLPPGLQPGNQPTASKNAPTGSRKKKIQIKTNPDGSKEATIEEIPDELSLEQSPPTLEEQIPPELLGGMQ
jgi:hypothetical protein